ncbi:hypothetical protein I6A60_33405 [Frankia sp. AgB1.9]|uniref:hypothetical protein n=1 Tax=unclassified Frankia TaxID=2632575 RepID=UPI001932D056|nr:MULTISPECIES: hypothetical protein [unclassified Frankia]MBL7492135.1 hypothetical protein [Frankia sp. AgW1.1]MBL7552718.1 hypothetical protein [Frankia sp. AgB1.9]MBL7625513.1 hypothetical protein [Frankia sp. AgB1.8]
MPSAPSRRALITGAAASSAAVTTAAAAGADGPDHTPAQASGAWAILVVLARDAALTPPRRRRTSRHTIRQISRQTSRQSTVARLTAEGC